MVDDNDDDDGRIARNLFRTESDSSSSISRSDEEKEENEVKERQKAAAAAAAAAAESVSSSSYVRHEIGNLILETQGAGGGSIAQRLWPAAQHLADFVLDIIKKRNDDDAQQQVQQVEGAVKNNESEQAQPDELVSSLSSPCHNEKSEANGDGSGSGGVSSSSTLTTSTNTTTTHNTGGSTTITTTRCIRRTIQTPCAIQCRTKLQQILLLQSHLYVVELGAGIGLTGLALAKNIIATTTTSIEQQRQQQVHVLLTDLDEAMNLLQRNIKQNQSQLLQSSSTTTTTTTRTNTCTSSTNGGDDDDKISNRRTVEAQTLEWGVTEDYEKAMTWYRRVASVSNYKSPESSESEISSSSSSLPTPHPSLSSCSLSNRPSPATPPPILFLGSDLVYWECLYEPLEHALFHLLFQAPMGSICLLAGMRRWKRDTAFYKSLGKRRHGKNSSMWQLQCTCIQEELTTTTTTTTSIENDCHANDTSENIHHDHDQKPDDEKHIRGTSAESDGPQRQREIFRIYIVELVRRR